MRAFLDVTQRERGVDHTEMGERLRKISERITGPGIDLFAEKIDIVREAQRGFVNLVRLVEPAASREEVRFPETAKCKRAFSAMNALFVAMHQSNPRN